MFVKSGSTLNVQAGTRVIGESGSVGTLIVERGGRLNAIGTATAPIVFTSDQPIGQRGVATGEVSSSTAVHPSTSAVERRPARATPALRRNGTNRQQRHLRYVRVEFAGIEFSPDNELNGIALQAVGRGPQVNGVKSHMSRDDAMG